MRKALFSTIALFALLFSSCENLGDDNTAPGVDDSPKFRVVSDTFIDMPVEGGNAEIEYIIDKVVEGATLTATSTAEWIDIEVGETIALFVESNTEVSDRMGTISIKYADTRVSVFVDQKGRDVNDGAYISITSERTLNFSAKGGNGAITYTITGGEEGDKPTVESNQTWAKVVSVESDKINISVSANNTTSTRKANISIEYGTTITVQVKQEAGSDMPELTASTSVVKPGQAVNFTVTYLGEDVTAASKIYEYYTKAEVSNPYTPAEVGEIALFAKYDGHSSDICSITVIPSNTPDLPADSAPESYDFNQRILLVSHTGCGCSYCPPVKEAFKDAEENVYYKDKFNAVFSYSFSSSEVCYSSAAKTLWNYYVNVCSTGDYLTGYPSFTTNFCFNYTGKTGVTDRIDTFWDKNVTASVALATKRDGNKLIVNAAVKSSKDQHIKIALWLIEDDVYATQSNATASWMHTHHNVMRDGITGISSSDIAGVEFGYVNAHTTYERVMNFDLFVGSSWNINNCKLIAIISAPNSKYDGNYEVVNTAICEIGGSIGFDYKK